MKVIVSFDTDNSHHDPDDSTFVTAWLHSNLTDALLRAPFYVDDVDIVAMPLGHVQLQPTATELVEHYLTSFK